MQVVWVNLSFLTSEINSYHEQYLGRQINHFPIEVGAQYFANANYCSARNNFFRGTNKYKESTNYGQVHHQDAVHINMKK